MTDYDPANWYWIVAGDNTRVYSSAIGDYTTLDNADYVAFLGRGNAPTRIASEIELGGVLADVRIRPTNANVLDGFKERHARVLTMEIVAKILLWLVNEVRTLKGQNTVTAAQFKAFIKDQM